MLSDAMVNPGLLVNSRNETDYIKESSYLRIGRDN